MGKYITKTPQGEIDFCRFNCPYPSPQCRANGCKEFLEYKAKADKERAEQAAKLKGKIEKVKKDLRVLRKLTHAIEVSMQVKKCHEKRIAFLREQGEEKHQAEIKKLEAVLSSLRLEEYISKATALETVYMGLIAKLEPIDRTIILDGYVNGTAYWKIGRELGYTEIAIKKRAGKIIERLAWMIA